MKTNLPVVPFSFRHQGSRSGSALLIALGCVALLTLLVVAFLVAARTEYSTSTFYARGVNTKLLSETALNTVMAQISQATQSNDALTGRVVAWASQPGMIRTYTYGPPNPNPVSYYKLYSWDNMATQEASQALADMTSLPGDWDLNKGVYTDLNEPVQTDANGLVYPILDGNNLQAGLTDIYGNAVPGMSYHVSTDAGKASDVEGFNVNTPPVAQSAGSDNVNVPMPVKWIYVLQDGTTVVAQAAGGTSPTAASVPGATAANKIVGRIAFWTDDETSKVNINTASEGNFWDAPLADGKEERTFAANIPVEGEYQRIPGHPATVSLSSVFGGHAEFLAAGAPSNPLLSPTLDLAKLREIYGMTPRMLWGGSELGILPYALVAETASTPAYVPYPPSTIEAAPTALGTKDNRLYSTIDELLLLPTTSGSPPTRTANVPLTAADLEQAKFFITATSHAPEVTLFNTPRISIWPITWPDGGIVGGGVTPAIPDTTYPLASNPYYTDIAPPMLMPEEKLLAFCGTVGGYPYYFQRQNAYDPTWDYANIQRNQDLIAYLDTMTTQPVPGFGGSFSGKYGADQPQIITEIFDYIRSGPDLNNAVAGTGGSGVSSHNAAGLQVNYNYAPIGNRDLVFATSGASANNGGTSTAGGATVVPITITHGGATTSGAGRYNTITEAALVFYAAGRNPPWDPTQPAAGQTTHYINIPGTTESLASTVQAETGSQTTSLGMYVLLNVYNTMTGYMTTDPYFIVSMAGANFSITTPNAGSQTLDFTGGETLIDGGSPDLGGWGTSLDAFMGTHWVMGNPGALGGRKSKSFNHNSYDARSYPFYADPVTVSNQDTSFTFNGSTVTLSIYPVNSVRTNTSSGTSPAFQPITNPSQTMTINFALLNGTYPMPVAPWYDGDTALAGGADNTYSPTAAAPTGGSTPPVAPPNWEIYNPQDYYLSTPTNACPSGYVDPITGAAPPEPYDMRSLEARSEVAQEGGPSSTGNPPTPGNGVFNATFGASGTGAEGGINGFNIPLIAENYGMTSGPYAGTFYADTVISMRLDPTAGVGKPAGDARLLALTSNVPASWFQPHYAMSTLQSALAPSKGAQSIDLHGNTDTGYATSESLQPGLTDPAFTYGNPSAWVGLDTTINYAGVTANTTVTSTTPGSYMEGDFANGTGAFKDGAIIPKPDDTTFTIGLDPADTSLQEPYYGGYNGILSTEPYFSPARQLSGPVAFGVLPTGVQEKIPWRTLVFNPNPMAGAGHVGLQSPPDHLLLDLFWMPVVEPYAISEPLSTAGKINMNYQIEPFTYINRQTALYAAMKSDKIFAIPQAAASVYKYADTQSGNGNIINNWGFHFPIDIKQTLQQFDTRFANGNLFVSASEICSIFLDPRNNPIYQPPSPFALPSPDSPGSVANITAWWAANNSNTDLTGANGRQQPYAHLYSLLTTKSNTFQVHMRVQVLAKSKTTDPATFDENNGDAVVGEYRGSAIIERYVDANAPNLPDFAAGLTGAKFTTAGSNTLDSYYRFRIVSTKAFNPR